MTIPSPSVTRLIRYLDILEAMELAGTLQTHSAELAQQAQVTAFQVRKDLSFVTHSGTRGKGYSVPLLRRQLSCALGLQTPQAVVIVGLGRLGQALAHFPLAATAPFYYAAFFDISPKIVGRTVGGLPVHHLRDLPAVLEQQPVQMALLAVPSAQAQAAADELIAAGIRNILNLTGTVLHVPNPGDEKYDNSHNSCHTVSIENIDFLAGMKQLAYRAQQPTQPEVEEL